MSDSVTTLKDNLDFIFYQNLELEKIGTKEQYIQYLNTIFPNSKIQDILYRGATKYSYKKGDNQSVADLTFFTSSKKAADDYSRWTAKELNKKNIKVEPKTYLAKINSNKILDINKIIDYEMFIPFLYFLNKNGVSLEAPLKWTSGLDAMNGIAIYFYEYIENYIDLVQKKASNDLIQDSIKKIKDNFKIMGGNLDMYDDNEIYILSKYVTNKPNINLDDEFRNLGYDTLRIAKSKDNIGYIDYSYSQVAVIDNNYHILGSEEDLIGFKKFVNLKKEINEMKRLIKSTIKY